MGSHTEYWATIATVIPVLTLALVVEARGRASRWTLDKQSGRRAQAWVYPLTLLAALVVEMAALDALARGRDILWAVAMAFPVVSLMFTLLVIMPAVELWGRGNADKFIRAVTLSRRRKLRKAGRRVALAQHRASARKDELLHQIGKIRDLIANLQERISSEPDCEERERDHADLAWCRDTEVAWIVRESRVERRVL